MRRAAVLCLLIVLPTAHSTLAQREPRVRPGVEVGMAYSLLVYDDEPDIWTTDGRFVPSAGAFVEILFMDGMLRLVPGLRGVRYGNKIDVNTGPDPVSQIIGEIQITQDYLAVPVLVKWKPSQNAGLSVVAGVEAGWLVSTRMRTVLREIEFETDIHIYQDTDEDIKDSMKSYNFSGIAGLGQQREIVGHMVSAQLRYNHGFVGTAEPDDWFSDWKTRSFEFILGVGW
jgi:hypothetical protein